MPTNTENAFYKNHQFFTKTSILYKNSQENRNRGASSAK